MCTPVLSAAVECACVGGVEGAGLKDPGARLQRQQLRVRRAKMAPSRAPLSSDRDPEFPSYEKAHIKSTSFGTLGSENAIPSIQLTSTILHIYSSTSRVII